MSKWVSTKDRLPEDREKVLIYSYKRQTQVGYLFKNIEESPKYFFICDAEHTGKRFNLYEISHWMPLPTPPNQESNIAYPVDNSLDITNLIRDTVHKEVMKILENKNLSKSIASYSEL